MNIQKFISSQDSSTQKDFADLVGVNVSTISRWLSGLREPSPEMARLIFEKTDGKVTPNDLFLPS